jgi:hypothetical protein
VFHEIYKNVVSIKITYDYFGMDEGVLNIPIYAIWNI